MTDPDTKSYLAEVLALDPSRSARTVMEIRRRFREGSSVEGGPGKPSPAPVREAQDRDEVVVAFQRIVDSFHDGDPDAFRSSMEQLELDAFPDLRRWRERMLEVDGVRDELEAMDVDRKLDRTFSQHLRQILVSVGPIAAQRRDGAIRRARGGAGAARGKRFVGRIRKVYPGIAAIEHEWLDRLGRAKQDHKDSAAVKGGLGCIGTYFLINVAIRGLRALLEWMGIGA